METAIKTSIRLADGTVELAYTDQGTGQVFLLLHGGAGPASMAGLAATLSQNARVITPTYPGFNGEPRPDWFKRPADLTTAYLALLEKLDVRGAVLVGNSFGGWIASEMALRNSPQVAGIVLLNAVGIDTGSPDKHILDPLSVPPEERVKLSYFNPAKFAVQLAAPQIAAMLENQKTLGVYASEKAFMHDPGLHGKLSGVHVPALVVWGEQDRIVDADYGRRFAGGFPGARFVAIPEAGHFPHVEQKDVVIGLLKDFAAGLRDFRER